MVERRAIASGLALTFLLLGARPASAQEACIRAYESAQEERQKNDLLKSRDLLLRCEAHCPSPFRDQCVRWKSELDDYLASIRVRLVDASGKELPIDATYVDARPADARDEIIVLPGVHVVRLESGAQAAEARVETKARQRGVVVTATLAPKIAQEPEARASASRVPAIVAFSIAGATGIAAIALSAYGHAKRSDLASSCAPKCNPDDVDPIRSAWWIGAGLGVLSAASAVVGVVLWRSSSTTVRSSGGVLRLDVTF